MTRISIASTVLVLLIPIAAAQQSTPPKNADEALALAKVELDPNVFASNHVRAQVSALLVDEQFAALEVIANEYRDTKARWDNGTWRLSTFYEACDYGHGEMTLTAKPMPYRQLIERWVAAHPESVTAKVALASVRTELGWLARGTGWAKDVTPEGWTYFNRHIAAAADLLEEAEAMGKPDPELYATWMTVGMAQSKSTQEMYEIYERCMAFERGYPPIYQRFAWALTPRWGGAPGELERFAKKAAEDSAGVPGAGAYAWICMMIHNSGSMNFQYQFDWDWELLDAAFQEIRGTYSSKWLENKHCRLMCFARDPEKVKPIFASIGRTFHEDVWPDQYVYNRWKRWADSGGQTEWPGGNGVHYGVQWNDPAICKRYLDRGDAIDAIEETGRTPLHFAAMQYDAVDAARFLIEQGADVNEGKGTLTTPLITATLEQRFGMVELLVEHGADASFKRPTNGRTALIFAAERGYTRYVLEILKLPTASIEEKDNNGRTALHAAALYGCIECVEVLLDAGADMNSQNKEGKTVLATAREHKREDVVKLLESRGATS